MAVETIRYLVECSEQKGGVMIQFFVCEIKPEYSTINNRADVYTLNIKVKTNKGVYGSRALLHIEGLQTESVLDLIFKSMKTELKKALKEE